MTQEVGPRSSFRSITAPDEYLIKNSGGFWAPFHRPNKYFLARQLP
jgi:hypothetical protein